MQFKPQGVCSKLIQFDIENNIIVNLSIVCGRSGKLQGTSRLIAGMDVNEAIARIEGIHWGHKSTSCPDQFAKALKEATGK